MKIMITGGTGFLGRTLTDTLLQQGHDITIFGRSINKIHALFGDAVTALTDLQQLSGGPGHDVIVNLAGAPIFDRRWSKSRKKLLRDSRIDLTRQLVDIIALLPHKPHTLISGSAIGYYGDQGGTVLTEQSPTVSDFSQQLCADWEQEALQAKQYGIRVCLIRTGLVLGAKGGMLQRMLPPFKLGLGGRIGNGRQWMSWIHIQDWVAIVDKMINDTALNGPYNATAPNPVTNSEFSDTLAGVLKKPACLPLPSFVLKPLLGEMSELVLGSQRVMPERLMQLGFQFRYTELEPALQEVVDELKQS